MQVDVAQVRKVYRFWQYYSIPLCSIYGVGALLKNLDVFATLLGANDVVIYGFGALSILLTFLMFLVEYYVIVQCYHEESLSFQQCILVTKERFARVTLVMLQAGLVMLGLAMLVAIPVIMLANGNESLAMVLAIPALIFWLWLILPYWAIPILALLSPTMRYVEARELSMGYVLPRRQKILMTLLACVFPMMVSYGFLHSLSYHLFTPAIASLLVLIPAALMMIPANILWFLYAQEMRSNG